MTVFEEIDEAIQANLPAFRKTGALTVRPGYKVRKGWIAREAAIVVTVEKKRSRVPAKGAIPLRVGGYPTDVREATRLQLLRRVDPATYAIVIAMARPEYLPPQFPLERDLATGNPIPPLPEAARPTVPYTPAPGVALEPVTDRMSIICVASPDAGWLALRQFLAETQQGLVVGLYDFTSAHVLAAVKAALAGDDTRLSLVLDDPPENPTADQTDEQTQQGLALALGSRESFAWAAEARDPKVAKAIFPSAYHIKVAVRDHEAFWLSSGNWNNSNQPDIDPWTDPGTADRVAAKSDRDWHVIVTHKALSQALEAYLKHDLEAAAELQAVPSQQPSPPAEVLAPEPELPRTVPTHYFKPLEITDEITVQPVLTPDVGAGNYAANILKLITSASQKLYIQTQYVHPPPSGQDLDFQALIDAIRTKMNAGLDVRIILSQYEATGGYLEKLQEAGWDMSAVRIQNGVHNKGFVVDSRVVAVGSQNWSGDGVLRNRDATLIVEHAGAARYFESIFLHDWDNLAHQQFLTRRMSPRPAKSSTARSPRKKAGR